MAGDQGHGKDVCSHPLLPEVPGRGGKESNKRHTDPKGGRKGSLLADGMIVCRESQGIYQKKKNKNKPEKLEQIREFTKAAGSRINIQKSIAFPHTSNKSMDTGIKNEIYNHSKKTPKTGRLRQNAKEA